MRAALFVVGVLVHLVVCARARAIAGRWRVAWAVGPALAAGACIAAGPFLASKALAALVMPAGLVWLVALAAASRALARASRVPGRRSRRAAVLACALFATYWAIANPIASGALLAWLERDFPGAADPIPPLDAVVLLGGGVGHDASGRPELSSSGDRVATAAALYHRGAAPRIVLTGGDWRDQPQVSRLGTDTRAVLAGMDVPDAALVMVPGPRNTSEEIAAVAELVRRQGWRRVGVVTSAWHMRRAQRLARKNRVELLPFPADHRGETEVVGELDVLAAIPVADALEKTHLGMWEIVGAFVGR
jgi:uncharacterized SAM-binding protein YcdF (DUF218 family)